MRKSDENVSERIWEKLCGPSANSYLLTEALITYGRVLARNERYGASLAAFRRAIELADNAGLMNRAAEAALAAFREIGEHLAASERGQLLSGRGVVQDKLAMEREVIKKAFLYSDEGSRVKFKYVARGEVVHMVSKRQLTLLYDGIPSTVLLRR